MYVPTVWERIVARITDVIAALVGTPEHPTRFAKVLALVLLGLFLLMVILAGGSR